MEWIKDIPYIPWIVGLIAIVSAVGGALIWRGKITSNIKMLNTAMEKIPDDMEKFRKELRDDLKAIREEFRDDMKEIRDDIKRIFERLPSPSASPLLAGSSPLQLTELGHSISKTLGASQWAAEIAPSLQNRVKGMVPYDVQEFCRTYAYREFQPTPDQEEKIKECAYKNALDRRMILDVFAIELRDALLS